MHYNKCIYCNQEKKENEFSLEHIFPDALGGTYANELFKTRQVCQKCNSLAGLYIDSLFVKNFFLTKLFFSNYIGYYDFLNKPYIPFTYIGFYEDITHPQYKFCEVWQWYDKSVVYHFHNNSEDDFKMIPGGDPRKRKNSHAGEVYLVGLVTNQFWIDLLEISFFKQFKKSRKIFVNYIVSNENINLTEIQLKIKDDLFLIHEKGKSPKYTVPIDFSSLPPVGPAIPLTAMPWSAWACLRTPLNISSTHSLLTAPYFISVCSLTPNHSDLISLA